jgi:hypothetical protein
MLNDLAERTAIPGWSPQKPKVCIAKGELRNVFERR